MYGIFKVLNKEYKLEYSVEASLYADCVRELSYVFMNLSDDASAIDAINQIADIPNTTLTILYAGLIEHHGEDGDKSVLSIKDARKIAKDYILEHKADGTGFWMDILHICLNQMAEDGFFKLTGLEDILKNMTGNQTEEQKEA